MARELTDEEILDKRPTRYWGIRNLERAVDLYELRARDFLPGFWARDEFVPNPQGDPEKVKHYRQMAELAKNELHAVVVFVANQH